MPGEILGQSYWYMYPSNMLCKVKSFFNLFTILCEAWYLLIIAIDRYRKVCQPHGWQIKTNVTKLLCGSVVLLSSLISLPIPFLYGTYNTEKLYMNESVKITVCKKDEKTKNRDVLIRFVQSILPMSIVMMFLLYVLIIYHIIKQRRSSQTVTKTPRPVKSDNPLKESRADLNVNGKENQSTLKSELRDIERSTIESFPRIAENTDGENSEILTGCKAGAANRTADLISPEIPIRKNDIRTGFDVKCKTAEFSEKNDQRIIKKAKYKTKIMFLLILLFFVTTIVYLILIDFISRPEGNLETMSNSKKALYVFFLRLVFINHVINPFVNAVLDTKYKTSISACMEFWRKQTRLGKGKCIWSEE